MEAIIAKPNSKLFEGCLVYCDCEIVYLEEYKKETKTAIIIPDYTGTLDRIEVPLEKLFIIGRQ